MKKSTFKIIRNYIGTLTVNLIPGFDWIPICLISSFAKQQVTRVGVNSRYMLVSSLGQILSSQLLVKRSSDPNILRSYKNKDIRTEWLQQEKNIAVKLLNVEGGIHFFKLHINSIDNGIFKVAMLNMQWKRQSPKYFIFPSWTFWCLSVYTDCPQSPTHQGWTWSALR